MPFPLLPPSAPLLPLRTCCRYFAMEAKWKNISFGMCIVCCVHARSNLMLILTMMIKWFDSLFFFVSVYFFFPRYVCDGNVIGLAGFVAVLGIGFYKYKSRGNMSTSMFLMQLRVASQGTVVGALTIGIVYSMLNEYVWNKKETPAITAATDIAQSKSN